MNRSYKSCYNKLMSRRSHHKGFTLVELSLSMVFIAILSILIVLIINNAVTAYHRGITLNLINTIGTDVVSDMRKSVQSSPIRSVTNECDKMYSDDDVKTECKDDMAHNFVTVERLAKVTFGNDPNNSIENVPVFGAFCTGKYSYIWNSGYFFNNDIHVEEGVDMASLEYSIGETTAERTDIKLLKVEDVGMMVCKRAATGRETGEGKKYSLTSTPIESKFKVSITGEVDEKMSDILSNENNGLALYDLKTAVPAESVEGNSVFYSVSFILGTVQGGININSIGNFCATPKGHNSEVANFNYCAINKFNFAAWANGKDE